MGIKVDDGGLQHLDRHLERVRAAMWNGARQGVRQTAQSVKRIAQENFAGNLPGDAPGPFGLRPHVRSSRLRGSIAVVEEEFPGRYSAMIGTNVKYGRAVEKGTGPRTIPVGAKGFLAFKTNHHLAFSTSKKTGKVSMKRKADWVFTRKPIQHPGSRPHPFLVPSLTLAVRTLRQKVQEGIRAAISRVRTIRGGRVITGGEGPVNIFE